MKVNKNCFRDSLHAYLCTDRQHLLHLLKYCLLSFHVMQIEVMAQSLLSQYFQPPGSDKKVKVIIKHNKMNMKMEQCEVYGRSIAARSICYTQFWVGLPSGVLEVERQDETELLATKLVTEPVINGKPSPSKYFIYAIIYSYRNLEALFFNSSYEKWRKEWKSEWLPHLETGCGFMEASSAFCCTFSSSVRHQIEKEKFCSFSLNPRNWGNFPKISIRSWNCLA